MLKKRSYLMVGLFAAVFLALTIGVAAQAKTKKPVIKKQIPVTEAIVQTETHTVEQPAAVRGKKNERPAVAAETLRPTMNPNAGDKSVIAKPVYSYEFTHPYFIVRKIIIEHNEIGKGTISFMKSGYAEMVSDPLQVSPAALERLKTAFTALNFLDSTEDYQYQKDFAHLGVMKISLRKDGRERTSVFNWTDNKDAKLLADEYRKLGNQYIWMFDINLARENQPLQAPGLMAELDSLVRRKEVSDPEQMTPFLRKLETDERIPLIARNHAGKIIKAIEKQVEKDRK